MPKKPLEKEVQKGILDWLRYKGIFCFKIPTTGTYKAKTNSFIPSQNVGAPDIMAFKPTDYGAVAIAIEVKRSPSHKLSPAQVSWCEKFQSKAGGVYVVTSSIAELEALELF